MEVPFVFVLRLGYSCNTEQLTELVAESLYPNLRQELMQFLTASLAALALRLSQLKNLPTTLG
jgi:hypothetical protein